MCQAEGASLQRGMNFRLRGKYSIFLMSTRPNAPYRDRVENEGMTLIYEGHDAARNSIQKDPKEEDQPDKLVSGRLTENGKFFQAADDYKKGARPELIRVYEKIRDGIWTDNGFFHLVDAWLEPDGKRNVFKFRLQAIDTGDAKQGDGSADLPARTRLIPSAVKQEVWLRDGGKCTLCEATDELHFDHVIPYSKGGSSLVASNIQLLCARHNLGKSAKIQ
jgi:hypothetical protein